MIWMDTKVLKKIYIYVYDQSQFLHTLFCDAKASPPKGSAAGVGLEAAEPGF